MQQKSQNTTDDPDRITFEQLEGYFDILRPENTVIKPEIDNIIIESDEILTRIQSFYTKAIKPNEMTFLNKISSNLAIFNLPK
jgi:hypothetical protein